MNENEQKVLAALCDSDPDFGIFGFEAISAETRLTRDEVAVACRSLRASGLAEYHASSWDDDGKPCGAGYAATTVGRTAFQELEEPSATLRAAEQVKK